jgi:hypothetical protein
MSNPERDLLPTPDVWPRGLPGQAREQLKELQIICADRCRGLLHNFVPFKPFGLGRRRDGGMSMAGGDFAPDVDDPISYVYETLDRTSSKYTAIAVVHDVEAEDGPRVRMYLEHIDGVAFRVWVPWKRLGDDSVRLLVPVLEPTRPLFWLNDNRGAP